MKLDIVYEDKEIIVCYKPPGIATQTASLGSPDLVSMLKNYLVKKGEGNYLGVIHRLDQMVSGLLVFAKTKKSAADLSRQIQDGNANKDYIALCSGVLDKKSGELVHYIKKDSVTKLAKVIDEQTFVKIQAEKKKECDDYKKAILTYNVEKEIETSSIIKVHLQTGRFHQIRAQFSNIGNALLGDNKYGSAVSRELSMKMRINKIALCANHLTLKHPITGKEMEFILEKEYLPKWYTEL